ncbi:MAG: DedA family protein [Candidatus Dormibacteria bacterium]
MVLATSLVDTLLGRFGYAAVFGFVTAESLGVPLPGEIMLISAALYAGHTHQLSIGIVIAVAAAAAIVGNIIGFGLGHWGGYRIVLRYGRYVGLNQGRIKLGRYLFARHGGKVVFFGRFVSILRTYAAFLAGTARMSWPRFLTFNVAGGVVWATAYGVAAYLAGDQINRLSGPVDLALAGVAIVVVVVVVVILRRTEQQLIVRAEAAMPGPLEAP